MAKKTKKSDKRKRLLMLVGLVVLVMIILATVILVQKSQENRSNAAVFNSNSKLNKKGCGSGSVEGNKMCGNNKIYICNNGKWQLGMNCSSYNKNCVATNQTNAECKDKKQNGGCGNTKDKCNKGTFKDTTDSSTYYKWQCVGSNGGTTASCSKRK